MGNYLLAKILEGDYTNKELKIVIDKKDFKVFLGKEEITDVKACDISLRRKKVPKVIIEL